jgi:hypothetical protein
VYLFSDFRKRSTLGQTSIPFNLLSVETDAMSVAELINGTPHRFPAYGDDTGGFGSSLNDILFVILRVLASSGGLPRKIDSRKEIQRAVAKIKALQGFGVDIAQMMTASEKIVDLPDGLKGDLQMLDLHFKTSLKDAPESCEHHVGTLCCHPEFHYIQCFLDQVHRAAKYEPVYADFLGMLRGEEGETRPRDRRQSGSVTLNLDKLMHRVTKELFKAHSSLMQMTEIATYHKNRIVWINDRMADHECVYIILLSRSTKRVTVVFRGTVTFNDNMKNKDSKSVADPNPIKEYYEGKLDKIETSRGYRDFLFLPRLDTGRTKFDEIADRVHEYGLELGGEGYTLCVTGHSLGGALASLFGFRASCDKRFAQNGNAVRVFTYGTAFPGRISFAKAFQQQERAGKIMHARCTMDGDIVPLIRFAWQWDCAHTGYEIQLRDSKHALPSYDYIQNKDDWATPWNYIKTALFLNILWFHPKNILYYHSPKTYMRALFFAKAAVGGGDHQNMSLEDHYSKNVLPKRDEVRTQPSSSWFPRWLRFLSFSFSS